MKPQVLDELLAELKKELSLIYARRLQGVYLFGSYARQEQDPESDLDILIVLSDMDTYSSEIKRTGEMVSRLSLKYGLTISRTFVREIDWETDDSPLLRNVRQEAILA
jgi:predicted nucleotidyltransferase